MGYGHAERNLALIRQLEAETRALLDTLDRLDPEGSAWSQEIAGLERQAVRRCRPETVSPFHPDLGVLGKPLWPVHAS